MNWGSAFVGRKTRKERELLRENEILMVGKQCGGNDIDYVAGASCATQEISNELAVAAATGGFANHAGRASIQTWH
jgi:hypothetical protein